MEATQATEAVEVTEVVEGEGEDQFELTGKQALLVEALLAAPTVAAAVEQAGVHRTTAWRWMREPGFRSKLREARRNLVALATARMAAASMDAAEALVAIAKSPSAADGARVKAAQTLLNTMLRSAETDDVIERLDALDTIRAESDALETEARILELRALTAGETERQREGEMER
jgi:hypothetical protein